MTVVNTQFEGEFDDRFQWNSQKILTLDFYVYNGTHWFADSILGQALVITGMMALDVMNFQELLANANSGLFGVSFVQMFSLEITITIMVKVNSLLHHSRVKHIPGRTTKSAAWGSPRPDSG